ncbi:hypothetical protein [Dyella flagellata]|uniref:Uncharacterized protein n=1 Tax=Dyella flagellata TaxID=1867833 RepID=A0ABQ5XHE9_9GAMM|nr:hypothetical protein [Dyella flagellata]GLQ89925.1 hypothetical protein GCM10007898_35000 [Dyella flagellata]
MIAAHGSLHIRRWQNRYLVSATHPSPRQVQAKLDTALRTRTAAALAPIQTLLLAPLEAEALYFIRHIALEWQVDSAADIDELARRGAQALGTALAKTLAEGENDNVIRFRDRAAYLARFVNDCAVGDAWQRWYYASFDGLRHLPASMAIRTALTEEPALGLNALLALNNESKRRVLAALSAYDIQRLLQSWDEPAANADTCFAEALRAAMQSPGIAYSIEYHALWLYLSISSGGGTASVSACIAVAALIEIMRELPPAQRIAWIAAFEDAIPPASHTYLQWLHRLPLEVRRHGMQQLAAVMDMPATAVPVDNAYTSFGGAFMLLSILDDMHLDEHTQDWPDLQATDAPPLPATQAMRWLLLAHAQGAQRMRAFLADPLWRHLLGVDARVSVDTITDWLHGLGAERLRRWRRCSMEGAKQILPNTERQFLARPASPWSRPWHAAIVMTAEQLMRYFAQKIPGFAASSASYLHAQFLDIGAQIDYPHAGSEYGHLQVTLERPPLALLLNLAGLNRGQSEIPWLSTPSLRFFSRE